MGEPFRERYIEENLSAESSETRWEYVAIKTHNVLVRIRRWCFVIQQWGRAIGWY
jgi:hypothetical protein